MATPSDISMRLAAAMSPGALGRLPGIERAGRHEHRRQADKRVKGRHQLRHRRRGMRRAM
jgi:hypothetical protein